MYDDHIADFSNNGQVSDFTIFGNFKPEVYRRPDCHTQQEIAEAVGVPRQTITDRIADFAENGQMSDFGIFGNFKPQQEIAEAVGVSIGKVNQIAEIFKNGQLSDFENFGNFKPEIYTIWCWR